MSETKKLYETEVVRRVYDNQNGQYLTVQPSPDFPGNVVLMVDKTEEQYFGALRLDLPAPMMKELALALLAACDEALKK